MGNIIRNITFLYCTTARHGINTNLEILEKEHVIHIGMTRAGWDYPETICVTTLYDLKKLYNVYKYRDYQVIDTRGIDKERLR